MKIEAALITINADKPGAEDAKRLRQAVGAVCERVCKLLSSCKLLSCKLPDGVYAEDNAHEEWGFNAFQVRKLESSRGKDDGFNIWDDGNSESFMGCSPARPTHAQLLWFADLCRNGWVERVADQVKAERVRMRNSTLDLTVAAAAIPDADTQE